MYYVFLLASITKHSKWKLCSAVTSHLYGFSHFTVILGPENGTEIKPLKM